jgi:hypothetical protein
MKNDPHYVRTLYIPINRETLYYRLPLNTQINHSPFIFSQPKKFLLQVEHKIHK